jgi:hypothetical protein
MALQGPKDRRSVRCRGRRPVVSGIVRSNSIGPDESIKPFSKRQGYNSLVAERDYNPQLLSKEELRTSTASNLFF